jgi:signal transduction histidine kinase
LLVETHKKRLKENKQRIKVTWETSLIITADKDLFVQLVHNLIWNFLKYAWKNTLLKINITKKYIDFVDNWIWVKSSEIPFLTEKFYQSNVEKSWNVETRWIWVGLSIVAKIVNSHNWGYDIKSDLGRGFGFRVHI